MSTKRLHIDILAKDKTKQALTRVQTSLNNVKNTVFSLKGALVGIGAGAVIKSFVDVGKEVESLQVRFKFLFGSVEEGSLAFDNLTKFASKVPFSLEEISRASGNLAVVSKDANDLNRILEITGNVAAVTGLDFETTANQIQRAFSGGISAADLFRERGVGALLGFKQGARVTAEETVTRFEELFSGNGRFAQATDDLATTLEGTLSMLGDKYFKFQKDVASGFFDELKNEFGDLNTFLEENEQQIKDIADAIGKNFAGALTTTSDLIKAVAPSVKTIADALGTTITGFKSLPTFVQTTGIIGALLFGKKGAIAFGTVSFLVGQIQELINKSNELKETRGLQDTFEAGELDAYKLSLEEINDLINSYKLSLPKAKGTIIDNETNRNTLKQIELLEQVAEAIQLGTSDAEDYLKIQNSLNKVIVKEKEELFKVNEIQDEILNKLERENLLRLSNTNALKEFKQKYDPITAVIEEAQNEQIALNKLVNDGVITADQAVRARIQIENELAESLQKIYEETEKLNTKFPEFNETLKEAGDITSQLDSLFTNTFNNFSDTLADSLMTGKFAFKDFARSVIRDIARMIAKQQALILLQRVSGFFGGNLFGFNIGGLIPKANGGGVNAGQSYLVGEKGPEMFVPNQSGTIIPNKEVGGTTNINFTINTVDAQGVDELITNRRSTIINVINDALNRQGKEALV